MAGRSLVEMIRDDVPPGPAVDLGCGTAPFARRLQDRLPGHRWMALDLAPGMLAEARARGRLDEWKAICADAGALPFAAESVSLVWSSFALQWSASPASALQEIARVLRPSGSACLAMPLAGSLRELREAWAAVDDRPHVNDLASARDWLGAIPAGLALSEDRVLSFTEHYPDLGAIHRTLKGSGAHHVRGARSGLTGRERFRVLTRAYEQKRQPAGLPLTWEVLFLVLEKVSAPKAGTALPEQLESVESE